MKYLHLNIIFRITTVLLVSFWVVACGGGVAGNSNNFVVVDDQTLINLNEIVLKNVVVDQAVCAVVYESSLIIEDKVGSVVLGEKTLKIADSNKESTIFLMRNIKNNETLFVKLHEGACAGDDDVAQTSSIVIAQDTIVAAAFVVSISTEPMIVVNAQKITNESLIIRKIVVDQPSWVVVHLFDETAENSLGEVVGIDFVENGHENDLSILIRVFQKGRGVKEDDELVVALYADNDQVANEAFDISIDRLIVDTLTSKIKATFFDAKFSLSAIGNSNYEWDGDATAVVKILTVEERSNSDILLTIGERYEITNLSVSRHPFELLNAQTQQVLLSQKINKTGSFEDDLSVNWSDENGVMIFTLTQELADQLSSYRCATHKAMSGSLLVSL